MRAQRRRFGLAAVEREPAAGTEGAARPGHQHARRLAGDRPEPAGVAGHRNRFEQPSGVRVMSLVVRRPAVGDLDRLAAVHDQDLVCQVGDDAEVVGDQDERSAQLALKLDQQLEHLSLNGGIERGGRLVGDDQRRGQRQGHRDHHALAHAAGELVRVVVDALFRAGDADHAEQVDGPPVGGLAAD